MIKLFSREGRKFYLFCTNVAGYRPRSLAHFKTAFIHKSVHSLDPDLQDNERLEFLGDSIIEAVVSSVIFSQYPSFSEGQMSKLRASLVCRARLNDIAFQLGLDEFIVIMNRGVLAQSHVPGDVLEALVAAVYLDGGIKKAEAFIRKNIVSPERIKQSLAESDNLDASLKTNLVCAAQAANVEIFFETHQSSETIDGDAQVINFNTSISLAGVVIGSGAGHSKKLSEQNAAQDVLRKIENGVLDLNNVDAYVASLDSNESLDAKRRPRRRAKRAAKPQESHVKVDLGRFVIM